MDQRPLHGIRVLALEQMQAMPYATQLLARLGADVIKVEHPVTGDLGRSATPSIEDPQGRVVGATFLRNNLGKRSIGIDLKSGRGRELVLRLAERADIFAENFRAGALARMGLGYPEVSARVPSIVYASVSGFGQDPESPYYDWPALASVAEAMSGIYDYRQRPGPATDLLAQQAPSATSAPRLFAVIGILTALRHRDRTGPWAADRRCDARLHGGDDGHRHQLLVHGSTPFGDSRGPRCESDGDHGWIPGE
jgi:crotonobetainyl-CoA:carnitine CoA-transferase CaiB-like acyl-CoA transferase